MNAPARIPTDARTQRIMETVKSVFMEAHSAGAKGEFFSQAWPESQARERLMKPAKDPVAAIERRDKTIYVFEEGLSAGMAGDSADSAWFRSYSRAIAREMAERAALRAQRDG